MQVIKFNSRKRHRCDMIALLSRVERDYSLVRFGHVKTFRMVQMHDGNVLRAELDHSTNYYGREPIVHGIIFNLEDFHIAEGFVIFINRILRRYTTKHDVGEGGRRLTQSMLFDLYDFYLEGRKNDA